MIPGSTYTFFRNETPARNYNDKYTRANYPIELRLKPTEVYRCLYTRQCEKSAKFKMFSLFAFTLTCILSTVRNAAKLAVNVANIRTTNTQ